MTNLKNWRANHLGQSVTILIVEDDRVWVKRLTKVLNEEADFVVVGVCDNKANAVEMALSNKPDVILMNLKLTDSINDGIEAIKEITRKTPAIIIALTDFNDEGLINQVWEAGVKDCLYKSQLHWLNEKIRDIYHKHSPTLVLLEKINRLEKENRFSKLTPAEKEILFLLSIGVSIEGIVKRLCKAAKTVHNQKSSFLKKLGVTNYQEAVDLYKDFIG
jgi:DNA-binding NarL/FixJ family response regulator